MNKHVFLSLVLFFLAFFFTGIVHLTNHNYLIKSAPELLRVNTTVLTSDDASYLAPAENFLAGKEWKSNAVGNAALTTRSPGYGLIYSVFRSFLSKQSALFVLGVFQIFLFAFAVSLLPQVCLYLSIGFKLRATISILVAVLPIFSGFLSYTLTEAVTPSLVIIFLFALFRVFHCKGKSVLAPALILGLLFLVRPPMLIWLFSIFILAFSQAAKPTIMQWVLLAGVALIPIGIWQTYISIETNKIQSIHPIYQADSNGLYRPLHSDIWNFHKSWGQKGTEFNSTVNALWTDALHDEDPQETVSRIIKATDVGAVNLIGIETLQSAYLSYFAILKSQIPYVEKNLPINGLTQQEKDLSETFKQFQKNYVKEYWFHSCIIVPLEVYLNLGAHSNLSLYIFQKSWRGKIFMEMLRYFSFFIHFGVFLCFPFAVILTRKSVLWLSVSMPVLIYLVYLCFVQRGVEERYTLPVLIPMLLLVVAAAEKLFIEWNLNFRNRSKSEF